MTVEVAPPVDLVGPWENPASKVRRRETSSRWYRENKERVRLREMERRHSARVEMLEEYGGVCACCGESNHRFLTLDHVYGDGGEQRKINRTSIALYLKARGWPKDGYQLLCFNCNCGRQLNGGVCPHQETK